jgi:hypothetical protein
MRRKTDDAFASIAASPLRLKVPLVSGGLQLGNFAEYLGRSSVYATKSLLANIVSSLQFEYEALNSPFAAISTAVSVGYSLYSRDEIVS